jgi:hypothetical protein
MQEEVVKHSRRIFKIFKSPGPSYIKKAGEIGVEIFIIVFAVSLSIWLHSINEHSKEQKEVRTFLMNIREDIKLDLGWLTTDVEDYGKEVEKYKNLIELASSKSESLNRKNDSISFPMHVFMHKINNGNYEGFKASGKIGYIENEDLKKSILNYYQQDALNIMDINDLYNQSLIKTIDAFAEYGDKTDISRILNPRIQFKINFLIMLAENNIRVCKERPIKNATDIIAKIDKELLK